MQGYTQICETAKAAVGPVVNDVVGRRAGKPADCDHSDAIENSDLTSVEAALTRYLKRPKNLMLGAKMTFPGFANDCDAENAIASMKPFGAAGKTLRGVDIPERLLRDRPLVGAKVQWLWPARDANRHIGEQIIRAEGIMRTNRIVLGAALIAFLAGAVGQRAFAHGDVTPQPVDTTGLDSVGGDWKETNPFRGNPVALKIGASGFNQNCARCHGLQAVSGGMAPDLRYLDKAEAGDAWFLNRIRHGYTQNGMTKMPAFEGILSQEAMWAIRTYLDSRYDGD